MDAALNEVRKFHRQIGAAVIDAPALLACQAESATEVAVADSAWHANKIGRAHV